MTQFILSLAISVFLIRCLSSKRTPRLSLLTGFFVLVTLFIGSLFLDAALSPDLRLFVVYAENTILALALIFLIQFAYRFPRFYPQHKWEAYAGLAVSLAYFAWEGGFMIYRYISLFGQETVYYRPTFSAYANAVVLLLAPLAFLRQSIASDLRRRGARSVNWLRVLWDPEGKEARAARGFVIVFGIIFALGLINILRIFNLPSTIYNAAMSIGILAALWLFATNYINFIPGGVSVQIKSSALTLTLFLALLGSAGWLVARPYILTFQPNLADYQTTRFTPDPSGGYQAAEIPFSFDSELGEKVSVSFQRDQQNHKIDFGFPFYGQEYDQVYIASSGAIAMGESFWLPNMQMNAAHLPAIFPLLIELDPNPPGGTGGGLYARVDADRLVVTWYRLPALYQPESIFTFQAVLYANGIFDISYKDLPLPFTFDSDATPSANPWMRGIVSGRGELLHVNADDLLLTAQSGASPLIENYQLAFRRYLHEFMLPLGWVVLGGSFLLLLAVPLLLRFSIARPLAILTEGVRQMEAGELTVELPIESEDEIGYLTGAFKTLAHRLDDLGQHPSEHTFASADGKKAAHPLTPRQWEVLEKVAEGYTYQETGAALHISERTVKYHIAQILKALKLKNRREAIRYFREQEGE